LIFWADQNVAPCGTDSADNGVVASIACNITPKSPADADRND
jgi:hypothetical protein